jgi:hypothetical protein
MAEMAGFSRSAHPTNSTAKKRLIKFIAILIKIIFNLTEALFHMGC